MSNTMDQAMQDLLARLPNEMNRSAAVKKN
jgi:hypothetical protein